MKSVRIAAIAGLVLAAAALAGVGLPEAAESATETDAGAQGGITVTGSGAVVAVPDRAELSFGVETRGATARAALAANATAMRRVVDALRAAGVAAADLRTQQIAISPRSAGDGVGIEGYAATNSVSARIRSLDRVAAVVDAAVEAGANQVYGPTFTRSNADALYRTALARAVDDARDKARALAEAAGLALGDVTTVVEAGGGPTPVADVVAEARSSTPIEPGTQEVRATVTVTFGAGS